MAWARVSGPSSDCGSSGQAQVTTEDQIQFYFKSSKKSNNGTDVNAGQLPQLLYKLVTNEGLYILSIVFLSLKRLSFNAETLFSKHKLINKKNESCPKFCKLYWKVWNSEYSAYQYLKYIVGDNGCTRW